MAFDGARCSRTPRVGALVVVAWIVGALSASAQSAGTDAGGFQPNRAYFSPEPFEHFDMQSGNLLLTFTDLVLPGNAGRDLRFTRVAHVGGGASTANQVLGLEGYVMYVTGGGFTSVPTWETPGGFLTGGPRLHFANSTEKQTFYVQTPAAGDPVGTMRWVITADLFKYNQETHTLYMPDGRICHYEYQYQAGITFPWYLTSCDDPFGNEMFRLVRDGNFLRVFQYLDGPGGSQTREVELEYGSPTHYVGSAKWMRHDGRTWSYAMDVVGQIATLTVTPPLGPAWTFTGRTAAPYDETSLTTPGGGQITYTYTDQWQVHPSCEGAEQPPGQRHGYAITQRISSAPDVTAGTWTLSYTFACNPEGHSGDELHPPVNVTVATPSGSLHSFTTCTTGLQDDPEYPAEYFVGNTRVLCSGPVVNGYDAVDYLTSTILRSYPGITLRVPFRWRRVVFNCDSSPCAEHETVFTMAANQNITKTVETGPNGTRTTDWTYQASSIEDTSGAPFFKGLLTSETVTIAGDSFAKTWTRDQATGFATASTVGDVTTTFVPDGYGNVASATTNGKTTNVTYEWGVVKNTQTPEYLVSRAINADGTVASETQGSRTTSYLYDVLGRRTSTQGPGGTTPTTTAYNNVTAKEVTTTRGTSRVRTTLDAFGRAIRTETGDTSSYTVKTTTVYDAEGRTIRAGFPVAVGAADLFTDLEYDFRGRVTKETNADGTWRERIYETVAVRVRDEEGRETVMTRQTFGNPAEGRISSLVDAAGETWTYASNVLGSLTSVTGPGGVTRTWTYETESKRLASEMHPESGTVQYTEYDAGGLLTEKVDANGTVFQYLYDGNNRVTQITATPEGGPPQVTTIMYEWGSDRRYLVMTGSQMTYWGYDGAGRVMSRYDQVDNEAFIVGYAYDATDNLTQIMYPSGRQVGYEYDTQFRLSRVFNVSSQANYATGFTYQPSGALATYTAGNGVQTTLTAHPTRQWLESVLVGTGTNRTDLVYAYDGVGNIVGLGDWRAGMTQYFWYDAVDRLVEAWGGYGTLGYTYDPHGNRQTANGMVFGYAPGNPFRLQSIGGSHNMTYDANGNLQGGFGGTYAYTPDNLLATSTMGSTTTQFTYDVDAWRLKKAIDGGPTYYYVRGPNGQLLMEWLDTSPNAAVKDYIYAGGRLIGVASTAPPN